MTDVTLRRIPTEEMLQLAPRIHGYAFRNTPPFPGEDFANYFKVPDAKHLGAFWSDSGKLAVSGSYTPMLQNIRGKLYRVGGVWAVAALPEARRSGITRLMMRGLFAEMCADDMPITMLYPFRESFYERLGYVMFQQGKTAKFNPAKLASLLKRDLGGSVEWMSIADGISIYRDFTRKVLDQMHGFGWWIGETGEEVGRANEWWLAVARDGANGEVIGVMLYQIKRFELMTVRSFFYTNSRGKYLLLEWIARHIDQVEKVNIVLGADERPETWMSDLAVEVEAEWPPLGRVLDVQGLNGLPVGEGRFTARIIDEHCDWNNGVFTFAGEGGELRVTPAETPDCDLTIQALSALVYGIREPGDFVFRGWGDPSAAAQEAMRAMFPPLLPYHYLRY